MKNIAFYFLLLSSLIAACGQQKADKDKKAATDSVAPVTGKVQKDTILPANGIYEQKYDNGQVSQRGEMRNGKREGVWMSYYKDGKPWSQAEYVNGIREGKSISWYPNGQKRFEGNYTNDKQTGVWKYWEKNGTLAQEVDYDEPTAQ